MCQPDAIARRAQQDTNKLAKAKTPSRKKRAKLLHDSRQDLRYSMREHSRLIAEYKELDRIDDINDAAFGPEC